MFRLTVLAALFLSLVGGIGAAHALAQAPQYWVTYAYDASTGAWGPGFGSGDDANTAKAYALRFCQQGPAGSTCEVTAWRCGGS